MIWMQPSREFGTSLANRVSKSIVSNVDGDGSGGMAVTEASR